MPRSLAASLLAVVCAGLLHQPLAGQATPIRGFSTDAVSTQRALEERFRAVPDAARLRDYMKAMSAEPHVAGRPGSKVVAEYALEKFKSFGLNASIEVAEAYMPWPRERRLEMVQPTGRAMFIQEPPVPQDPDSLDEDQTPTYNAYSADGEVTGEVVYVNFGMPADYEELEKAGVSVKGKIVLARYGGGWRGIKPKVAWEHGAVGCLIYSDPERRRLLPGRRVPGRTVPPGVRRAARQRDGHAGPHRRSAHPRMGRRARRPEAAGRRGEDHPQDPGDADRLGRRQAAARGDAWPGGPGSLARRAAHHLPPRPGPAAVA